MLPFYGISTSILTGQSRQIAKVVKNHNDKTFFLTNMSVPSDTHVSNKIFEKLSKYKDLEIEVSKMWLLINNNTASSYWCIRYGGKGCPKLCFGNP